MWNNQNTICQKINDGKRYGPSEGAGILSLLANTGAELFIQKGIPWLGKQAFKKGRYYASELLREPTVQKNIVSKPKKLSHKGLDYAIDSLSKDLLNKASNKLLPKDMRSGGNIVYSNWYPMEMYTDTTDPTNPLYKRGGSIDIHEAILKVAPKKGFVMPGHRYTGPGNPLEQQLKYNPNTGEILEIYQQPTGKTDAVSMQHDVDYSVCANKQKSNQVQCKNDADRKMVKALDSIPWKERQWGHTVARNTIAAKAKLGLGVKKPKNVKSRRVKKTGKKN